MTTLIIRRVSGVLMIAVFLLSMASTVTAQSETSGMRIGGLEVVTQT